MYDRFHINHFVMRQTRHQWQPNFQHISASAIAPKQYQKRLVLPLSPMSEDKAKLGTTRSATEYRLSIGSAPTSRRSSMGESSASQYMIICWCFPRGMSF
ncbi:BFH_collapsed_G0021080.mRNA.1.CDS.1 [Saccharomyces cerevisiae]|nr:BFH_collapsed_G0021080.mRNA.1.CDS.1 [Saccharomyces cerevisiae]